MPLPTCSLPALSLLTASLLTPCALVAQRRDTVVLTPIVVTATRVPVSPDAVAAAVTVVTGTELRARGIRTVAAALRLVSGTAVVETGSFGGQTSLFLRGGESDYVKVLLDGAPLNQPGGAVDLADVTTDNVERIEIVRGPASVLYGSDAVTGVVQIFTRAGLGTAQLSASARAGTYGTTELAAEAAGGTARLGYGVGVSRFGSSGLYMYNNDYRNTVASGRLRLAPDERTDASLAYRWGDNVYHFPTNGAGEPVDSNQVSTERGPVVSVEVGRRFAPALEVRALGTWRETRMGFRDEPDSPGEDGSFTSRDLVRRAGTGALVHWRLGDGTIVTGGVEYEDERQRGRSVFAASFGSFPDSVSVRRWNMANYAQILVGMRGPVGLQAGVRHDVNSRFGRHATYRIGANYRWDDQGRVRAALGTGFKAPTFFENFAQGFVRGNPDLAAERSLSWEVGVERQARDGRLALAVTYFDQRFRDPVEFSFAAIPPDSVGIYCSPASRIPRDSVNYCNVGRARAHGVELEASLAPVPGVSLAVSYTYLRTRVTDPGLDTLPDAAFAPGRPLLRRPAHAATVAVTRALGSRGSATLTARAVGAREDLDFSRPAGNRRTILDPYTRLSVSAEYEVLPGHDAGLTLTAQVENLFDDATREIANFRSRRRTLFFGGRLRIGS